MDELREYLPDQKAANQAVAELLELARESVTHPLQTRDDMGGWEEELNDEAKARQRFRYEATGIWKYFGAYWGRGLQLGYELVPDELKPEVMSVFNQLKLWNMPNGKTLQKVLKQLTGVAKKHANLAFPTLGKEGWKHLVNWENMGDFVRRPDYEDAVQELRDWVTGSIEHKAPGPLGYNQDQFRVYFREGMRLFLNDGRGLIKANANALTIRQYAERPHMWKGSGSSSRRATIKYVGREGKEFRVRKNKTESAMAMDAPHVEAILRDGSIEGLRQRNTAVGKRERGKYRWVVSADLETFIRMDYVFEWVDAAMAGNPNSPLFMGKSQTLDMWRDLEAGVRNEAFTKIPLDQSHFDWQQNKEMISDYCDEVKDYISANAVEPARSDYLTVWNNVRRSLVDIEGTVTLDGSPFGMPNVVITIDKGVISGWRITADIGTIMNVGELHAGRETVKYLGGPDPVVSAFEQGDDDQVTSPSYGCAASLAISYEIMNFEVNPNKFFISTWRDEFLRLVILRGDVSGYMVRGVGAVLFRNPVSRDPPSGVFRIREQVAQWNILLSRGAEPAKVKHFATMDVANGNGLSYEDAFRVMGTPTCLGGAGWLGTFWSYDTVHLGVTEGRDIRKFRVVGTTFPGMDSAFERTLNLGITPSRQEFVDYFGKDLDASEAEREVVKGEVFTPPRVVPYQWKLIPSGRSSPVRAMANRDITSDVASFGLDYALGQWRKADKSGKQFWIDWIHSVWMEPDMVGFSDSLKGRAGNRVWIDWLTGKLPWKKPNVQGWSNLLVSETYERLLNDGWSRLAQKAKITMTKVLQLALAVELQTVDHVVRSTPHLGN